MVSHFAGLELEGLVPAAGRDALQDLREATGRARELVRAMLEIGRVRERRPDLTPLPARIERTADLLRRVLPADITLELDLRTDQPVAVDLVELDQILVNLVVNARDAMPHGGRVLVQLESVTTGLALRVIDDGEGMDDEVLARAREPFFSTKRSVGGSGLGLSMVSTLVCHARGRLDIQSAPGQGTTVQVTFPHPTAAGRPPVVLLVDDEPLVRRAFGRTLQREGYVCLEAGSAHEAVELLDSGTPIDLLVSD